MIYQTLQDEHGKDCRVQKSDYVATLGGVEVLEPILGMNFWLIPTGALILAIPFIFWRGATDKRLRPLFFGWWFVAMIGLGGTTPIPKIVFGTRIWEILTYERFTYWATLMALPFAGLIAEWLIDRFRGKAVAGLALVAVLSGAGALACSTSKT